MAPDWGGVKSSAEFPTGSVLRYFRGRERGRRNVSRYDAPPQLRRSEMSIVKLRPLDLPQPRRGAMFSLLQCSRFNPETCRPSGAEGRPVCEVSIDISLLRSCCA